MSKKVPTSHRSKRSSKSTVNPYTEIFNERMAKGLKRPLTDDLCKGVTFDEPTSSGRVINHHGAAAMTKILEHERRAEIVRKERRLRYISMCQENSNAAQEVVSGDEPSKGDDFPMPAPDDYDIGSESRYSRDRGTRVKVWNECLSTLAGAYFQYLSATDNLKTAEKIVDTCVCDEEGCRRWPARSVTFITMHDQIRHDVVFCDCDEAERLMACGFLACTPSRPGTAVSLHLLRFLHILWCQSAVAVTGYAKALWTWHNDHGDSVKARNGSSHLERDAGKLLLDAVEIYRDLLFLEEDLTDIIFGRSPLKDLEAKCPSCFGPREPGDLADNDVDFIVAMDANFSQSRLKTAAKYDFKHLFPSIFLSTDNVNEAMSTVENHGGHSFRVQADVHTACSDDWKAMNGGTGEGAFAKKADSGLMGMVCRHDVCLKLINLHQGERFHNGYALLKWLLDSDPNTKVGVLYDIGCNFEAHLRLRGLLTPERDNGRLKIGVSVFHAYAHSWGCQVSYNPRLIDSFGYTNGEGVERFWSILSSLVKLNRPASASLRLSNIHFRTKWANTGHLTSQVDWLVKQYSQNNLILTRAAKDLCEISEFGWSTERLRAQWGDQKKVQSKAGHKEKQNARKAGYSRVAKLIEESERLDAILVQFEASLATGDPEKILVSASQVAQVSSSRERLAKNITEAANKLGDNGGDAPQLLSLCRLQETYSRLRHKWVDWKMVYVPFKQSRQGRIDHLGTNRSGRLRERVSEEENRLHALYNEYQKVANAHIAEYSPVTPPPLLESFQALKELPDGDLFWRGLLYDFEPAEWADNPKCREGIRFLLIHDRAVEERRRLDAEIARVIRWCQKRHTTLDTMLHSWGRQLELSARNEVNELDKYIAFSGFTYVNTCRTALWILRKLMLEHTRLERQWMGDGLGRIWHRESSHRLEDPQIPYILEEIESRLQDLASAPVADNIESDDALYRQGTEEDDEYEDPVTSQGILEDEEFGFNNTRTESDDDGDGDGMSSGE